MTPADLDAIEARANTRFDKADEKLAALALPEPVKAALTEIANDLADDWSEQTLALVAEVRRLQAMVAAAADACEVDALAARETLDATRGRR